MRREERRLLTRGILAFWKWVRFRREVRRHVENVFRKLVFVGQSRSFSWRRFDFLSAKAEKNSSMGTGNGENVPTIPIIFPNPTTGFSIYN